MSEPTLPENVTVLLNAVREGKRAAFDQLIPLVYDELRQVAQRQLRRERREHTLYPTALVNEVYLKLVDQTQIEWENRAHFFGIAARSMRQILIDYARRRDADKRGGDWNRTTLTNKQLGFEIRAEELLSLDAALDRLDEIDERCRQVVEYRFFGGMTEPEIAAVLGVSERTVQRDWLKARAWLYKELYSDGDRDPAES